MSGRWTAPARSDQAAAVHRAAEEDARARPGAYDLDPDTVFERAVAKDPAVADTDPATLDGLRVYLDAARREGRLNAVGRRAIAATAVGRLRAGASTAAHLERHPGIRGRVVDRPIVIIGGWRTGTTLLQRLLAAVGGLRGLHPAELSAPWACPDPADAPAWSAFLDTGGEAQRLLHLLNPTLEAVHPFGSRLPEECVLAMGSDLRNWGFTSTLRCPSYVEWLWSQDLTGSYRRYADVLRTLQGERPDRWVLKAPAHTAELDALLRAFPDACVVHLHRDVVEAVTSAAGLFAVFRSTYSDEVDPVEVGEQQLEVTARWFERAMAARQAPGGGAPARFVDVAFDELAADPIATARGLCSAFGVELTAADEPALRRRLAELDARRASAGWAPEQFGLDPDRIGERLQAYRTWCGLP